MDTILLSIDDYGVATLTLNRVKALNAINVSLMVEVQTALEQLAINDAVKVLIITANGSAFCAGADLTGVPLADVTSGKIQMGDAIADMMQEHFNPLMQAIYDFPKPVISALNGIAAGGGVGLALCADIVVAAESAKIRVVQVNTLGIVADLGANWLLPRLLGRGRAMAISLLGDDVSARTLQSWGAVWQVVEDQELLSTAQSLAKKLAKAPASAVVATRRLVDRATEESFADTLEAERVAQQKLCNEPVFFESVKAFVSK